MLVSVIIPCYNAEDFITKAVESALSQKETGEVILIEDGSTDNSLLVCERLKLKYKKVKLFRHPDGLNHGAGASRNLGLRKAQHEYVSFLDGDDYYLKDRFNYTNLMFKSNSDIDGVYEAAAYHYYSEAARERYLVYHEERCLVSMKRPYSELFEAFLTNEEGEWFPLDTLTIRRSAVKKVGYFDESLRQTQDTDWILRLCLKCKLIPGHTESPVATIGIHDNNRVHNQKEAIYYRFKLLKKWWVWVIKSSISKKSKQSFIRAFLDCHPLVRKFDGKKTFRKIIKGFVFLSYLLKSPRIAFFFL